MGYRQIEVAISLSSRLQFCLFIVMSLNEVLYPLLALRHNQHNEYRRCREPSSPYAQRSFFKLLFVRVSAC